MKFEYTEKMLYNQLLYLSNLFDVDKSKEKVKKAFQTSDSETQQKTDVLLECNRERFDTARNTIKGYLDRNGRQWVQMDSLFGFAL